MELVAVPAPFTVMIDFAHNGLSMTELVKAARAHHPKRLLTVFGLEGNRSHDRRFESGRVLGREFDQIILADASPRTDDPDQIIADIASGIVEAGGQGKYQIIRDRHQAIPAILDLAQPGDLVLLIGKGNVPYEEVMGVNHPLSERVIVEDYFAGKCTQSSKTA
jgi:UDP-N-acetylmuramoyl-L-alanyl-D-glutamate--2,6-diaminopimelate ligase